MTAAELAGALDGRRYGRGWRARCPSHPDKHPSLDIADRDGRTVFICRAGCTQRDVIEVLKQQGIWAPSRDPSRPRPLALRDQISNEPLPEVPACCMDRVRRCVHWQQFGREYLVANMLGNLSYGAHEISDRYASRGLPLDLKTLIDELNFAIPFGALVPEGIDNAEVVARAVDFIARRFMESPR
jgi:hypothetical protein